MNQDINYWIARCASLEQELDIMKEQSTIKWQTGEPKEGMVSIEMACEWLKFNYTEYLNDSMMGINIEEMVEDFRKAMEE